MTERDGETAVPRLPFSSKSRQGEPALVSPCTLIPPEFPAPRSPG